MLLFKNGRFHRNGVSFMLPDNFYLDTAPDAEIEGLMAWSPNKIGPGRRNGGCKNEF